MRNIATRGQFDADGSLGTLSTVILLQLLSQGVRLAANDRIVAGGVVVASAEHLKGDQILVKFSALAVQRSFADKSQESRQAFRLPKTATGENELKRRADLLRLGGATTRHFDRCLFHPGQTRCHHIYIAKRTG